MQDIYKSRYIKRITRQSMRGKWLSSFFVMFAATIILSAPSYIVPYFTSSRIASNVLFIYRILAAGPVTMGITTHFLDTFRGVEEPGLGSFGRGLGFGFKAINLFIMIFLVCSLWAMLFLIPGIIAIFRYSQSFFILADHPDFSVRECMAYSRQLMYQKKGRFFLLELSFVFWIILAMLPSYFAAAASVQYYGSIFDVEAVSNAIMQGLSHPLSVSLSILTCFVYAYMRAANACFYDIISGNLRILQEVSQETYDTQGIYSEN